MAYSTLDRLFHLRTPLGDDVLLVQEMEGREWVSRPFEFVLTLVSERDDLEADDLLGKRVSLDIKTGSGLRHWTGMVWEFERLGEVRDSSVDAAELTRYHCKIVPWLRLLTLNEDSRIFQDQSIPDILEAVFGAAGFKEYELQLHGSYPPLIYCSQYRESDFDFVSRLMERAGIHYYFRHEDRTEVLVLDDSNDSHPEVDCKLVRFSSSHAIESEDTVFALTRRRLMRTGRLVMRDYNFEKPSESLESMLDSLVQVAQSQGHERFVYPGDFADRDAGERAVRIRMEAEEAEHEILDGTSNMRTLAPGHLFDLDKHPQHGLNQEYMALSVEHRGSNNLGSEGSAGSYSNRFAVIPRKIPYREPIRTPKATIVGPQSALVVGPPGEEIHTDQYGRVKVHFYWDRFGHPDERSSCWVRVAHAHAGSRWGTFMLPRVGEEVLVAFEHGDPDRPIIVGSLYNANNMPPYPLPAHATISTLKTNSSKGGGGFNELRFEDKKGREQVMIHAQNRMDVCINGNYCERNGGQRDTRVGKDWNRLVGGDVNQTTRGGWYEAVDCDDDHTVSGCVHHDYQGDLIERVPNGIIDLNSNEYSLVTKEGINIKSDSLVGEVAGPLSLRGGAIVLEGSDGSITLSCGESCIKIAPNGVFIDGKTVKINCGGAPTPADSAKIPGPFDMEEPLEPLSCACGTPGESSGRGSSGAPRTRKKKTVYPVLPPDWKPPKPPPPPPKPEVPNVPCDIRALKVACAHTPFGNQRAAAAGVLQVVPSAKITEEGQKKSVGAGTIEMSIGTKVGEKDTITIDVELGDETQCTDRRKQWAVTRSGAPTEAQWRPAPGTHDVPDRVLSGGSWEWPSDAAPDKHYVYGRGATARLDQVRVEVFPSRQYEASLTFNSEKFKKVIDALLELLDRLPAKANTGFKGLKVSYPAGKGAIKWGWAEYTDWRSFFAIDVSASYDPFLGVEGGGKADFLELLLIEFGIPPGISKYIAESYMEIKWSGKLTLTGRGGISAPGDTFGIGPELGGKITGDVFAGVGVGNTWLAGIEIKAGGTIDITATGGIEWVDPNLWFKIKVKFGGFKIVAKLIKKSGFTGESEENATLDLIDERTLYEDRFKLIGP